MVTIPPVRTFPGVLPDKEQALKPLGKAAEVFNAWQLWDYWRARDIEARHPDIDLEATLEIYRQPIVDELYKRKHVPYNRAINRSKERSRK